jgi:hypothetical protein
MVLHLLEETLGAVPIDEHGYRLYRRARPGRSSNPARRSRPGGAQTDPAE